MSLQVLLVAFTKLTYKFCSLPCHSMRMSVCLSVCDAPALKSALLYRAGGSRQGSPLHKTEVSTQGKIASISFFLLV